MSTIHEPQHIDPSSAGVRDAIIVHVDGSYEATEALGWAGRFGLRINTPVAVAHNWQPGIGELRPEAHAVARRRHEALLRAWCAVDLGSFADPRRFVIEGGTEESLLRLADQLDAALIVVGLELHSYYQFFGGDSLARQLVRSARRPQCFVPVAGATRPIRRIVVALDDRSGNPGMHEWALRVATAYRAEVHAVSVIPLQAEWVPTSDPRSGRSRNRVSVESAWASSFEQNAITNRVHIVEGADAVHVWTEVAHNLHADLIIVGSGHSRDRLQLHHAGRLVRLSRTSGLPVIVVPFDDGAA